MNHKKCFCVEKLEKGTLSLLSLRLQNQELCIYWGLRKYILEYAIGLCISLFVSIVCCMASNHSEP